MANKGHTNVKR